MQQNFNVTIQSIRKLPNNRWKIKIAEKQLKPDVITIKNTLYRVHKHLARGRMVITPEKLQPVEAA